MKFKKITLRNIRSYKEQEIVFPSGTLLLSGEVGSGKTSVLHAIEYALFGLQPGQKGNSLLRNGENLGEVSLELEVGGETITIDRKLKRSQKGVSNDYAAITLGGEKTELSITELKSKIVELLGYPTEFIKKNNTLYRYTVYTPQEQMKQIITEDPQTRLNILRHIFGIDKYKKIRENLTILLNHLRAGSRLLQGEMKTLERDKESIEIRKSTIELLKEKIKDKNEELKEKTSLKTGIELELENLEKKIAEKNIFEREVEKTNIFFSTKNETLVSITRELTEIQKTLQDSADQFNEEYFNSILNQIDLKTISIEELTEKNAELSGKLHLYQEQKQNLADDKERIFKIDICPTCLQDVSETHKHTISIETERKFSEIEKELRRVNEKLIFVLSNIEKHKQHLQELNKEKINLEIAKSKKEYLSQSKQKVEDLKKQKQLLENDLVLLSKHTTQLKENILKYSVFDIQFRKKQTALRQATLEEKQIEISIAELKKEKEIGLMEISLLETEIQRKENIKIKLYELQELTDWLSSEFVSLIEFIERNVLLKLRAEFSRFFRKWFTMLIPEGSLDSRIDDNFTPIIMQGEAEMEYEYLSGGERTAVALAYRLALNQTINSALSRILTRGLVILDEPTDGFSEEQIDKVRDILEEINSEQLIIVSHEPKIEGFVDNILKVSKIADSSILELVAGFHQNGKT